MRLFLDGGTLRLFVLAGIGNKVNELQLLGPLTGCTHKNCLSVSTHSVTSPLQIKRGNETSWTVMKRDW